MNDIKRIRRCAMFDFMFCVGMLIIFMLALGVVVVQPCPKYILLNEKGNILYESVKNKEMCEELLIKYSPNGLCLEQ